MNWGTYKAYALKATATIYLLKSSHMGLTLAFFGMSNFLAKQKGRPLWLCLNDFRIHRLTASFDLRFFCLFQRLFGVAKSDFKASSTYVSERHATAPNNIRVNLIISPFIYVFVMINVSTKYRGPDDRGQQNIHFS